VSSYAVLEMAKINNSTEAVFDGSLQLETIAEMRNAFNRVRIEGGGFVNSCRSTAGNPTP
jgi:methyl-accepting chemotaxis protein